MGTTIHLDIHTENGLVPMEDYKPTMRKPEGVCFWCHGSIDQEELDKHPSAAGKYYAMCKNCASHWKPKHNVFMVEAGDIQGLIDQPYYEGVYPTGAFMMMKRETAMEVVRKLSQGAVEPEEDLEEVILSMDAYELLEQVTRDW